MPHLTEIILIALIVFIVFGMGRLPRVANSIGRLRSDFKKGAQDPKTIDITPEDKKRPASAPPRKPGKINPGVEDANIDSP